MPFACAGSGNGQWILLACGGITGHLQIKFGFWLFIKENSQGVLMFQSEYSKIIFKYIFEYYFGGNKKC